MSSLKEKGPTMFRPRHAPLPAQVKVSPQGRIVIPVEMRRELGVGSGETLVARVEGGRLVLEKASHVLSRLKERFAQVPEGVSLSAELIRERREEARRESAKQANEQTSPGSD